MCAITASISERDNFVFMFAFVYDGDHGQEQSHVHKTCIATIVMTAITAMTTKITMKAWTDHRWMNMHQSTSRDDW